MAQKAKSYSYVAFQGAWSGRSRGMWSTAILGITFGALIGAVAPFFPVIVGTQTLAGAVGIMGSTMAVFAAAGMGIGFTLGGLLGASAGSISSVTKEQENRDLQRIDQASPALQQVQSTDIAQAAAAENIENKPTLKDTYRTYFNPRVGVLVTAVALVGGAIMSAAFVASGGVAAGAETAVPGMALALGKTVTDTAAISYITGVMGAFGSLWFLNFPKMGADLQDVTGRVLSGELLGRTWEPEKSQEQTVNVEHAQIQRQTHIVDNNVDISSHFRDKLNAEIVQSQNMNHITAVRH